MTTATREPTEALWVGRRALDSVTDCQILQDFRWIEASQEWALHLRLMPAELPVTELVPSRTDWFLTVNNSYPSGRIGFYPAKVNGLTSTFWHQSLNSYGLDNEPWRKGNICTDTILRAMRRYDFDEEPRTPRERIRWHVLRALAWLIAAARGELATPGSPYELPAYPCKREVVIGFAESPETLGIWSESSARMGLVDLVRHPKNDSFLVLRRFSTCDHEPVVELSWGSEISQVAQEESALWLRLNEAPVLPPWQPPTTWRELQVAAESSGVNLCSLLTRIPQRFRNLKSHILLIGFPVPRSFGGPEERMHWLAVRLPVLSFGQQTVKGYRGPQGGWQMRDRQVVFRSSPLEWLMTENWSADEIATRGRYSAGLRHRSILLIGAGALGSAVAELLVRGGVHEITIVDPDTLQAGNLVRHSLGMLDIGRSKASAMAAWLNLLSPHARIQHLDGHFPSDAHQRFVGVDLVIDCTAEDDVLVQLASYRWREEKLFVSFSLGIYAQRLFVFMVQGETFPLQEMAGRLQPWLLKERATFKEEDLPWEALGCWHPIFPARVDDIRLFAAVAVKSLDRWIGEPGNPEFLVFERGQDGEYIKELQHV